MKIILLLISTIILFGWTTKDEPCQKRYNIRKDFYSIVIYPNCSDTTIFLTRTYENERIYSEEWFKNNKLNGLGKYYVWKGKNVETVETLWENNKPIQSISYFPNSAINKDYIKQINDSINFSISYYSNGNIKEYGLYKFPSCYFGVWTEQDSLTTYKWTGKYKLIHKTETIKYDGGDVILTSCSEKDSVWVKTNNNGKVLEKICYSDGKLIKTQ